MCYILFYSTVDPIDWKYVKNNFKTAPVSEDPNNPIIKYLKKSGFGEKFQYEAKRLYDLDSIEGIMNMALTMHKGRLREHPASLFDINSEFFEIMRRINIKFEDMGWGTPFKANIKNY